MFNLETVPDASLNVLLLVKVGNHQLLVQFNLFIIDEHQLLVAQVPENHNQQDLRHKVEENINKRPYLGVFECIWIDAFNSQLPSTEVDGFCYEIETECKGVDNHLFCVDSVFSIVLNQKLSDLVNSIYKDDA